MAVASAFQQQSWLGRTLVEARTGSSATPIIARPTPPSRLLQRDCALDRGSLSSGAERSAKFRAAQAKREGSSNEGHVPVRRVRRVLPVPDFLSSQMTKAPYSIESRAAELGVSAEMDRYNFSGSFTRNLSIEGPEEAVKTVFELAENALRDLQQRSGLVELQAGDAPAAGLSFKEAEQQVSYARVMVDGIEETVTVDKDVGPMWDHGFSNFSFGPACDGRRYRKEWKYMSPTEREVLLITTAKKNAKRRSQSGEV
mmetsp:Transcript_60914/g.122111  ORF Transcript_60914/g.122111 Transcript_60914/m.122111 type:complete len:256 (-) Transcript_60914:19-786(-)